MMTRRAASSRGCWSFTRAWDWASILLSEHEGLRSSVTSRWLLTCSAIADRRETLKTGVDWSETFETIQQAPRAWSCGACNACVTAASRRWKALCDRILLRTSVLSLTFESQLVANMIHSRHEKRLDCT